MTASWACGWWPAPTRPAAAAWPARWWWPRSAWTCRARCDRDLSDLDDSKRLTEPVRERLFHAIVRRAAAFAVVVVSADEIDRRGLHRSNLDGLARALWSLGDLPEVRLSDGFRLGAIAPPHRAIVGGDGRSAAIAAASVLAKVTRDRYMHGIADRYPGYGFEHHVGYITPEHTAAVRSRGADPAAPPLVPGRRLRRSWAALA